MATITASAQIAGVFIVEPAVHGDERGLFVETYRREWIPGAREMIQSNRGDRQRADPSARAVVRDGTTSQP